MKKTILITFVALLAAACTSKTKNYEVIDWKGSSEPGWSKDEFKESNSAEKYFVSAGEDANKRLCQQQAEAHAIEILAKEISAEIDAEYAQSVSTGATESKNDVLKFITKAKISGLITEDTYWEQRREKGNKAGKKWYACKVLKKLDAEAYGKLLESMKKAGATEAQ
jgi:hypothetical protein